MKFCETAQSFGLTLHKGMNFDECVTVAMELIPKIKHALLAELKSKVDSVSGEIEGLQTFIAKINEVTVDEITAKLAGNESFENLLKSNSVEDAVVNDNLNVDMIESNSVEVPIKQEITPMEMDEPEILSNVPKISSVEITRHNSIDTPKNVSSELQRIVSVEIPKEEELTRAPTFEIPKETPKVMKARSQKLKETPIVEEASNFSTVKSVKETLKESVSKKIDKSVVKEMPKSSKNVLAESEEYVYLLFSLKISEK